MEDFLMNLPWRAFVAGMVGGLIVIMITRAVRR